MKQLIQRCGVFLMILLLISGVLSSCGAEEGIKVEFAEPAPPSSSGTDEITSIAPSPGHIVIGQTENSNQAVSESVMNTYTQTSGSTMEIKKYTSDKALIDAARSGEIDIVFGNNLVAYILGYEDSLVDLEPTLTTLFANGEYYTNIIDAGRIDGKLVMVTPQFDVSSSIVVPQGAVKECGSPINFSELLDFFDLLEPEYRSGSSSSMEHIHGSLDLKNRSFDITPMWDTWTTLLRKQEEDQKVSKLFTSEKTYHALFGMIANNHFQDPITHYSYYTLEKGTTYTKYGSKAVLIPYAYQENIGFSNNMATYCIPEQAQNKSATLHLIQWLMSEEGQEAGLQRENSWTGYACPILRTTAQRWFLRYRNHKEPPYTAEEQRAIVEGYIAQVDHLPTYSRTLLETTRALLDQGSLSKEDRDNNINQSFAEKRESWKILYAYFEKLEHEEEIPKFYQEGALAIWPELVNDYVRAYITDLGYEMH